MSEANEPTGENRFALPPGYDGLAEARRLLRSIRAGGLGTLTPGGHPFVSLASLATDHDGAPILLMSQLSAHTRHLDQDPLMSLLLAETGKGDPLAHPRLTLVGRAARAPAEMRDHLKRRFLARHPKAALYADFGDFSFWRVEIATGHLNGGFAKAASYQGAELLLDLAGAAPLLAAEADVLEHMNTDHAAALELYASRLLRESPARWRATGLDPEGLDLAAGDRTARLVFPNRLSDPGSLREVLVALAQQARAAT
jgi:putative heme iron utilization protein